jgi:hypothetical protein
MTNLDDAVMPGLSATAAEQPAPRDASYQLEYAEDGVFVLAEHEDAGGRPLQAEIVLFDLSRRGLLGLAVVDFRVRLRRGEKRIRVADAQDEPDADFDVLMLIASDAMSADMVLLPACGGGRELDADELLEKIHEKWGVVFGLDEEAVQSALQARAYYQRIPAAAGKPSEKGEDGRLVFLFSTQHSYAPKIAEDGSADYKNLNVFESVTEGAALVQAVPPGEGAPGCTVKGAVLPPRRGAEAKLPKGKNVRVSEDGQSLIATKSGRVDCMNGRVEVADVYRVSGDVDMSVGNILFEGDVIVAGNVISGLTIEAAGTIEVHGYVEAAELIAGKDIVLKNGMQGMGKGRLSAGENIVARFLERCNIEAKENIFSDYIVECKVIACGLIAMKGKWGRILGGTVRAGKGISANIVGSPSNELTVIELGASPDLRARSTKLEETKNQIRAQLDKIHNVARVIPSHTDSPDRLEMRQKLISAKEQLQQQYEETVAEMEALAQKLKEHSGARLHVFKTIYPNVKLIIDSCFMTTRSTIEFATFCNRDGEIVFTACEARP